MQEINEDFIVTYNKVSAVIVLQKYARAAKNTKKKVLVIAYQGLENYYKLINITIEAKKAVDKA